jgi:hypothetical protein
MGDGDRVMKVLIINFNRVTLSSALADWVFKRGCEPVFIDNASDYKPLLEYYATCPYEVVRMDKNYGKDVVWDQGLLNKLNITGEYILTDPDLDLTGIPDNFLKVLREGLSRYPQFDKCGFSLEINDVTDRSVYFQNMPIKEWELQFWCNPMDSQYFNASIDTTFALYKTDKFSFNALRTNRPYTARHIPWYYDQRKPEDEIYYCKTATAQSNIIRR